MDEQILSVHRFIDRVVRVLVDLEDDLRFRSLPNAEVDQQAA